MTARSDPLLDEIDSAKNVSETGSGLQVWRSPYPRPAISTWPERIMRRQNLRRFHLNRASNLIWLATFMLEFLFAMRFLLKLMDANPSAGFAVFVYNMSRPFLLPFFGLTATPSAYGSVLEIPTVIAMIVYAVWSWLIVRIIWIVFEEPVSKQQ